MNEKLRILKASIDSVLDSTTYTEYQSLKQSLELDAQYKMYEFIINNKDKFSANVYAGAKLKYVYKQSELTEYRKQLDSVFTEILKLYDKY